MAGLFGIATIQKIRAAINAAFASVRSSGTTLTFTKGDGSTSAVTLDAANRVGTATVGAGNRPIFLNAGTPTASSAAVGSSTKPLFMAAGVLQACGNTLDVNISGTASRATYDADGNNIASTYAKRSEVSSGGVSGSGSNFTQLDSGLMMCWAKGRPSSYSNSRVVFPVSFVDDHVLIIDYATGVLSVNRTGYTMVGIDVDDGGDSSSTHKEYWDYNYVAIGRWK